MNSADFSLYDGAFFASFSNTSYQAGKRMLGHLYRMYQYRSVTDFGCGSGTWLRAAKEIIDSHGAPAGRLLGIDGFYARGIVDEHVAEYVFQNIEDRIRLDSRFDLAISLEVAEHLTPGRAESFVEDICAAADVVLFGAAIPHQGGQNHINEQWQEYWARIFERRGYGCYDVFRAAFWDDTFFEVCPYYVSNALLYVRDGHSLAGTLSNSKVRHRWHLNIVHPAMFVANHYRLIGLRFTLKTLPAKLVSAIRRRISGCGKQPSI